jgi:hypothetical protein
MINADKEVRGTVFLDFEVALACQLVCVTEKGLSLPQATQCEQKGSGVLRLEQMTEVST